MGLRRCRARYLVLTLVPVSTRRGNGAPWQRMRGQSAVQSWTLALPNTDAVKGVFQNGQLQDIVMIVTYSGTLPSWP